MAITVNPPIEVDQITGEEVAVDPATRVIKTGVDATRNTETLIDDQGSPFDPGFKRSPKDLNDPASQQGASEQDLINFWTSKRPLT